MSTYDIWGVNAARRKKTSSIFARLTIPCEDVLESQLRMIDLLHESVKTNWGDTELPPFLQFVSAYFVRNTFFLVSAYMLACGWLCGPCKNLQRTIYETILRSYLFIVDNEKADLMYADLSVATPPKRRFWYFDYLVKTLYTKEARKHPQELYRTLSRYSHPSILGAFTDSRYSEDVEDCLKTILALSSGNIQVVAEGFVELLNSSLKRVIKECLVEIADALDGFVIFEPNQKRWAHKIRITRSSFLRVLK